MALLLIILLTAAFIWRHREVERADWLERILPTNSPIDIFLAWPGRMFHHIWRGVLWLTSPFRRLPFRMAVRFTLASVIAILVLELVAVGAVAYVVTQTDVVPSLFASTLPTAAIGLAGAVRNAKSNPANLHSQLEITRTNLGLFPVLGFLSDDRGLVVVVTDMQGNVLASAPGTPLVNGKPLSAQMDLQELEPAREVLSGDGKNGKSEWAPDHCLVAAAPIPSNGSFGTWYGPSGGTSTAPLLASGSGSHPLGMLYVRIDRIDPGIFAKLAGDIMGVTTLFAIVFCGIVGLIFGAVTTRPLARRLRAMAATADGWSRGDLTALNRTWSDDEIGQLAVKLNAMAAELKRHVLAEQRLAAVQERNRLARDLHDTVKQQAFAAAMQLGAARTVLGEEPGPAGVFVAQAERLINKVQEDLMAIIHEIHPDEADIGNRSLGELIRDEVAEWSHATGIPVEVDAENELDSSPETKQTLQRILLEALTNISRHSSASLVTVEAKQIGARNVEISVADNGCGFDPSATPYGMGIYSMRDRALALPSGRFSLEAKPGEGTTIRVSFVGMDAESKTGAA